MLCQALKFLDCSSQLITILCIGLTSAKYSFNFIFGCNRIINIRVTTLNAPVLPWALIFSVFGPQGQFSQVVPKFQNTYKIYLFKVNFK